jgi:hypothetical protein
LEGAARNTFEDGEPFYVDNPFPGATVIFGADVPSGAQTRTPLLMTTAWRGRTVRIPDWSKFFIKELFMATPTASATLAAVKPMGELKKIFLRRHVRKDGWGDMTETIATQIETMCAGCTEGEVALLLAGDAATFMAKATAVAQGLIAAGLDAASATSGPIITALLALLQQLLPMLLACIPAA